MHPETPLQHHSGTHFCNEVQASTAPVSALPPVEEDTELPNSRLSSVIASMKLNIRSTASSSAPIVPSGVLVARTAGSVAPTSAVPAVPAGIVKWTDLEADPPVMRRFIHGEEQAGTLKQGTDADGMAIVTWPDGKVETTEVPNLLIVPMKRPAASVLKRPAKARCSASADAPAGIALEHVVLYYKNNNHIGIRQKPHLGGKQIFSFGGKHLKVTEQQLREIGVEVCKKLADGWSAKGAREWALHEVAALLVAGAS